MLDDEIGPLELKSSTFIAHPDNKAIKNSTAKVHFINSNFAC